MNIVEVFLNHPLIPLFIVSNLVISWWAHRKAKTGSFEDYALANRNLPVGVLVMTLLGTRIGGGDLAEPDHIFKYGIIHILISVAFILSFLLTGTFFAPSLVYFPECMTTGDLMGKFYGRTVKIITGIVGCTFSALLISAEIEGIGGISYELLGMTFKHSVLFFGFFVVFYSVFGGMRVVSYTDILQIIAAVVVLGYVAQTMMEKVDDWHIFKNLPDQKSLLFSHPEFFYQLKSATVWGLSPAYVLSPPIVQRMLMTKDKRQVRQMWYSSALLYGFILVLVTLIGLAAIANSDYFRLHTGSNNVLLHLIKFFSEENSSLRYLISLGLLCVLFSTIDSYLHAIGVSLVQDIINPLKEIFSDKTLPSSSKINYAKIGGAFTGIIAVFSSVMGNSQLLENHNTHTIALVVINIIAIPLFIGVLGIKTDNYSLMGFAIIYVGSLCRQGWEGWYVEEKFYDNFLLGVFLGLFAYFLTHIYIHKGFATLKRSKLTVSERLWLPSWEGTRKWLSSWLAATLRLPVIADRKVVTTPTQSLAFSLVMIFLYMVSSVINARGANEQLYEMTTVRGIGIILCVGLMLEGIWLKDLKPYFPMYWFFTLWYCLPFSGSLTFLQNHGTSLYMGQWMLTFIILGALVDSTTFITLSITGISVALGVWYLLHSTIPSQVYNFTPLYIFVGISLSILLFFRRREMYNKKRLEWNHIAGGMLARDLRGTVQMLHGSGLILENAFKEGKQMKGINGKEGYHLLEDRALFLKNASQNMVDKAHFAKHDITGFLEFMKSQILGKFEQGPTSMKEAAQAGTKKVSSQIKKRVKITCLQDFTAKTLPGVLPNAISSLLNNASTHGGAQNIEIIIDAKKRTLTVHDDGKGIPADILPSIFRLQYNNTKEAEKRATGLSFVHMVMEASGGKIFCYSKHGMKGSFTEFVLDFSKR
ncbi:MAG: ATP-binding protein [Bacteroidota bacterium]